MRPVLTPLIEPYVVGAKLLSDWFVKFVRNSFQRPIGKWIVFGLIMVTLAFTAVAFTDYINGIVYDKARCPVGYSCDPAAAHTVMLYANAISTLMYWATVFVGAAIMIRVGLSLKLVDILRWSKLNRVLAKHTPSHMGFVNPQTEQRLLWWCGIMVCLSIVCSIAVVVLTCLTP